MTKTLTFGVFILSIILTGSFGVATAQTASAPQSPAALVLAEEFSYPVGQLTTGSGGNWTTNTGTGNFIPVLAGSLSYPGYPSSGIDNKILLTASTASSEDAFRSFTTQTSGTTYAGFLVNVINTDLLPLNSSTTGEYFAGFISSASTSAFAARVTIRQGTAPNTFQLGLRASGNAGNTQVFSTTDLPVGNTVLIVISYQLVDGGPNDVTKLWINPVLGGSEPAPSLTQVAALDLADVGRFFVRQGSGSGVSTPNAEVDGLRVTTAWADLGGSAVRDAPGDFNGDGKTDFSIVRPGPGGGPDKLTWWIRLNGVNTHSVTSFGIGSDFFVPADYDGDGSDDIAIWRSTGGSGFWVLRSSDNTATFTSFGQPGDDPFVVADYTNDGTDDMAIFRKGDLNSEFWILPSSGPYKGQHALVQWGFQEDIALFGDYNGDGFADFTVVRDEGGRAVVYTRWGSLDLAFSGSKTEAWGLPTDFFVPGDYDGDGTTDLAITRYLGSNIRWIIKPSGGGPIRHLNWGLNATDLEAHGDYDGDGITDLAIWRHTGDLAGYFIVRLSGGGVMWESWGGPGDSPTIWEFK